MKLIDRSESCGLGVSENPPCTFGYKWSSVINMKVCITYGFLCDRACVRPRGNDVRVVRVVNVKWYVRWWE